jgi:quinoprotein glucose dehydrogenase
MQTLHGDAFTADVRQRARALRGVAVLLAATAVTGTVAAGCARRPAPPPRVPSASHTAARDTLGEWGAYGRDALGGRWSPLTEIRHENVARLAVAWSARTGEAELPVADHDRFSLEATPVVVDGTMYVSTPLGRVLALDAVTGARRWTYDPGLDQRLRFGDFTNRGVAVWLDSAAVPP